MASREAIEMGIAALMTAGCPSPQAHLQEGGMEAAIKLYQALLPDLDDQAFEEAIFGYLRAGSAFWPTPGQLLTFAPGRKIKEISDAGEAWGELLSLASGHGRHDPPGDRWSLSDDPDKDRRMASGLLAVGGWTALCNSDTRDHTAHRAAFRTAYENQGRWMEAVREDRLIGAAAGNVLKLGDQGGER